MPYFTDTCAYNWKTKRRNNPSWEKQAQETIHINLEIKTTTLSLWNSFSLWKTNSQDDGVEIWGNLIPEAEFKKTEILFVCGHYSLNNINAGPVMATKARLKSQDDAQTWDPFLSMVDLLPPSAYPFPPPLISSFHKYLYNYASFMKPLCFRSHWFFFNLYLIASLAKMKYLGLWQFFLLCFYVIRTITQSSVIQLVSIL